MPAIVISARLLSSDAAKPAAKPFELSDSRLPGFTLRVQPSGARTYYARRGRNFRVRLGSVGELTPDEARERCGKVLGNVAHGRPALLGIATGASVAGITLRQFIGEPEPGAEPADDTWLQWAKVKRRKSWYKTLNAVKRHYSAWFDLSLAAITPQMIDKHMLKRLGTGAKPSSVRRDCDALAGMLTRAVACKLLTASPMKGVEKPKLDRNPKPRFLSDDEERSLRDAMKARDAEMIAARDNANRTRVYNSRPEYPRLRHFGDSLTPAVRVSLGTGMRLGETLRLRWRDITSVITLEETKGIDTRHQPILPDAQEALRKWRQQSPPKSLDDFVFPVRTGYKKAWKALLERAGIRKFTWRQLRHSYASGILQEGGELSVLRELMGHKDISTTLRYAHLAQSNKDKTAALLNKRLKRIMSRPARRGG